MIKIDLLLATLITYKARTENDNYIVMSDGNKKLKGNSRISFLIWNLPAVITCPYRTNNCERFCYATKAEKAYPDCLPARTRNFEMSRRPDFVDRMIYTIKVELDRPKNKNKKIVFRIHESGDFYNKAYVDKWLSIIRHFENDNRIVFVAYTKSVKYFDGVDIPANMALLASVWDDTKRSNLDIIARNNFRIYTAYKGEQLDNAIKSGFARCRCEDCATCGLCWNNYVNNVCCEIH